MTDISENIDRIQRRIDAACCRSGRAPQSVRLIAVSKIKPAEDIEAAAAGGQRLFGESYAQELRDKVPAVTAEVEWHFIGALQRNKVKYLRGAVALIHGVDRLSLAEEIDRQWSKLDAPVQVLLQVNLGNEATKAGIREVDLEALARQVASFAHLSIRGLMALPPDLDDPEEVRPYFRRLRELAQAIDALNLPGVEMQELSMGMSDDFEVAIEEGATLVRVGTAIFGARPKKVGV